MFCDVEFKDLVPERSMEEDAAATLRRISETAPYGSNILATVTKAAGDDFLVVLQIRSEVGQFEAHGAGPSVRRALDRAEWTIQDKLAEWRRTRPSVAA